MHREGMTESIEREPLSGACLRLSLVASLPVAAPHLSVASYQQKVPFEERAAARAKDCFTGMWL